MRPATALLAVLGSAALLGAALFAWRVGAGRETTSGARGAPAPHVRDERPTPALSCASDGAEEVAPAPPPSASRAPAEEPAEEANGPAPRPDTVLVFRVIDARTSAAVEGFEARLGQSFLRPLLDEAGRVKQRFPEGRARFEGVIESRAGENVQLSIRARGYEELRRTDLFVPAGRELDLGVLRLERAPPVEVHVLDAESGEPVAGALVSLLGPGLARPVDSPGPRTHPLDPWAARTGRDGWAQITSRPGETAMLAVRHPRYAPLNIEVRLPLSEEQREVRLHPAAAPR